MPYTIISDCPRCGRGVLLPKRDYKYKINYEMCLQCGHVIFDSKDDLGTKRYRLTKNSYRRKNEVTN